MTQLIDKKAVLEAVKALPAELDAETVQRCIEVLSNQPTADAIPIEYIQKTSKEWAGDGYEESAEALDILVSNWVAEGKYNE